MQDLPAPVSMLHFGMVPFPKKRFWATRAELDMTTLLHEIFLCQDHLDEIAKKRQPLAIKRRGGTACISGKFTT